MSTPIVVAGTGTDVGKTVFAAALVRALQAAYWKPIQAGLEPETDSAIVQRLADCDASRILPEAYRLTVPASPHLAAERDGIAIDTARLTPPQTGARLIIEPAGGLSVPLTRDFLQIDLLARWNFPVVLCAATRLGTINHSLLSIEALERRDIPIIGIAFIGDENPDSERTIAAFGGIRRLGRLPRLDPLNADTLHPAFAENFAVDDFLRSADCS